MASITSVASAQGPASAWSPLRLSVFRWLWIATLASNIGTWMHDVGAGWLMTSLSPSAVMVALVQTATSLPIFLLALPAGALSDIVDRRRYLIVVQVWMALVAAFLAILALTDEVTAWTLVALTFAMGVGTAMMMPAWAAVTPELVPRVQLQPAIALNSLGINVARAIGPALAGVIVSLWGTGAVFALNALSYVGVIWVLVRWRRQAPPGVLPSERFLGALRAGLRFARHAPALQAAVIRGLGFFLFASASWALLPLVARSLANGGPQAFGILVAMVGVGAVAGALLLPRLHERVSRDALVAGATVLYAVAMLALSSLDRLWLLALAMVVAGVAWISILSSLQVAAQMALPDWVRSRGLAVFMAAFMGSMALGSLLWGKVADLAGIATSLQIAAVGLVAAVALTWHWRISGFETVSLSPSMHWPAPIVHAGVTHDRGPVLVTIQYQAAPDRVDAFLSSLRMLGQRRRRDGAIAWAIYEDTERPNHFIESFCVESWLEHLRQHERVTDDDRALQDRIRGLLAEGRAPRVSHYVAPSGRSAPDVAVTPDDNEAER
ncbi:MAG: MFS transporter [Thiocapsa sp.]|nr:MFS transporter [Thiocapsa sp.]MCG6896237.1 MFS transporter [Thiocapsa sp.]MCG6983696.1 MFS transporter [Thiocapsa sp.]